MKHRSEIEEIMKSAEKLSRDFDAQKEGCIIIYGNGNKGHLIGALLGTGESLHNVVLNMMFKDKKLAQVIIDCAYEFQKLRLFDEDDDGCQCEVCKKKRSTLEVLLEEDEVNDMINYVEKNPNAIN